MPKAEPAFDPSQVRPLPREFFDRDPRQVGRDLLGKVLVRRDRGKLRVGRVVEVEVYLGQEDPAAHAYIGRTARNSVLFGPPGHAYVYFIYGNHYCLNVSCEEEGRAGCVLFRALEPVAGIAAMERARGFNGSALPAARIRKLLASGPGRLSDAMAITRERDNAKDLTSSRSDLWLGDDGFRPRRIAVTPRVGIKKAIEQPLRYLIAGSQFLSKKI